MPNLTDEELAIARKIEKLLRLAAKAGTEAEAAAATAKAQELLAAYNLDAAAVEQGAATDGKREDASTRGGLYHFQRELWSAVAELNFCFYWSQYRWDREKVRKRRSRGLYGKTERVIGGWRFEHRLVGRVVNTTATRAMAGYLEQTIERLTRERLNGDGSQFFTKWAIAYREGIAERVIEKVWARRRELLSADEKRAADLRKAVNEATAAAESTATALTLSTLRERENDGNWDFLNGEGWSAKQAAERAARAKAAEEADRLHAEWAAANPEEARKQAEEQEKAQRKRASRGRSSWAETDRDRRRRESGGFAAGYEAGRAVSIDPQVDRGVKIAGRIGR